MKTFPLKSKRKRANLTQYNGGDDELLCVNRVSGDIFVLVKKMLLPPLSDLA
jgi:hypothetical protein